MENIHTMNKDLIGTDFTYKHKIVWKNVLGFLVLHIIGIYGFLLIFSGVYKVGTILWESDSDPTPILFATIMYASVQPGRTCVKSLHIPANDVKLSFKLYPDNYFILSVVAFFKVITLIYLVNMGITVGVHRYFTHKTFKAKPLLRFIFIILQTLAGQNSVFIWARDHRQHHRFSDTDADPHNSKRGFFFSHMGWLMVKKHPYVIELGRKIDMSDLKADPLVIFQKKYYYQLYLLVAFIVPVAVPVYLFGETWFKSVVFCYFSRNTYTMNATWLVNSAAHLYGNRPYDKSIQPVESWFVSLITSGEGWHNYHHTFPWDYKAAEAGMPFNYSAMLIRFLDKTGLVYELKSAHPEMIRNRILRTGNESKDAFEKSM